MIDLICVIVGISGWFDCSDRYPDRISLCSERKKESPISLGQVSHGKGKIGVFYLEHAVQFP
jgi:hypothetical protein